MKIRSAPRNIRSFFLLLVLLMTVQAAFSQDSWQNTLPAPTGFVNDFAGVMDAATKQQLETRLKEFKQKTNPSVEIAVAIVDTTGDRPIVDYSLAMARQWKIGNAEDDNPSALLFVAIKDRKYFTQISKDLEDELPDGLAGQLQRQYLVPEFKQGNYSKGIADTIEAYIKTIEAKQTGTAAPIASPTPYKPAKARQPAGGDAMIGGCICLGILIVVILSIVGRRSRGRGWGGGVGDIAGAVASNAIPMVIGAIIGGALRGGGSSSSSSSSDWGGSSGSSGGSDWGGFGGGGDFGGGGAGGDW